MAKGANLGNAYITIIPTTTGAEKAITDALVPAGEKAGDTSGRQAGKKFSAGMAAVTGAIAGVAGSIASKAFDHIAALTGEMVEASDNTQKFKQTLQFANLDAGAIDSIAASAKAYADATVYSLSDIQNATAQLAANSVPNAEGLVEAMGNLNAAAGGSAETFSQALLPLTQITSAGVLHAQDWMQIVNAMPGATGQIKQALLDAGAYTGDFADALSKGEITADEFNGAIQTLGMTDVAKDAATSTQTIEGALGNLDAQITSVGMDILDAIKPTATSVINTATTAIGTVWDGLKQFIANVQTIQPGDLTSWMQGYTDDTFLLTLATGFDRIYDSLTHIVQTIQGSTAIQSLSQAFAGMLPVVQAIGEIFAVGLVNFISGVIDGISIALQVFDEFAPVVQPLLDDIATTLQPITDTIMMLADTYLPEVGNAFNLVGQVIGYFVGTFLSELLIAILSVVDVFVHIPGTVADIMTAITTTISNFFLGIIVGVATFVLNLSTSISNAIIWFINAVANFVTTVTTAISDFFAGLIATVATAVANIFNPVRDAIAYAIDTVRGFVTTVVSVLSGFVGTITGFFLQDIPAAINNLIGFFKAIPGDIKSALSNVISVITSPFKSAFQSIRNLWNNTLGGKGIDIPGFGAFDGLSFRIPKLAKGGTIDTSGYALVGENGPELLDLPRGASVTPLTHLQNVDTTTSSYNVTIGDVTYADDDYVRLITKRYLETLIAYTNPQLV